MGDASNNGWICKIFECRSSSITNYLGKIFFTVAFTFPIMFFFFRKNLVWTDKPKLQFIRGLILLSANICFFYAISVISLAKALTLAFVAPLIVTAFSPIFLGEKVGLEDGLL